MKTTKTGRLLVIANIQAGMPTHTGSDLKAILDTHHIHYTYIAVKTPPDAHKAVLAAKGKPYKAIAVYGGDGTVLAAIKAAAPLQIPILILPGGTANVMAKHANIPTDIDTSLASYASRSYALYLLPLANIVEMREPLILHLHFGFTSQTLKDTSRKVKRIFGIFAYLASILKAAPTASMHTFKFEINGKVMTFDGYACVVVNSGTFKLPGGLTVPRYQPGRIQIMVVRSISFFVFVQWYIWRILSGRNLKKAVSIIAAKRARVLEAPKEINIDDEHAKTALPLTIEAAAYTARLIVPVTKASPSSHAYLLLKINWHRAADHLRRSIGGASADKFTRIDKNLYLGGQYGKRALATFKNEGITGIISMRLRAPKPVKDDPKIELLHLPTVDHTAPTIEYLLKGIAFINQHAAENEAVYVHCRLGEGRGPTMAAAYLMSLGLSREDAVRHLQRFRPFAKPNKKQLKRLDELAKYLETYKP